MTVKHLLPLESEYRQRPEYFRVTIFGESAGSASIGHLLLSDVTTGLFSQVDKSSFVIFPNGAKIEQDFCKHWICLARE